MLSFNPFPISPTSQKTASAPAVGANSADAKVIIVAEGLSKPAVYTAPPASPISKAASISYSPTHLSAPPTPRSLTSVSPIPDVIDADGETPLVKAVTSHDEHLVRTLVRQGHDIDKEDAEGFSPLSVASAVPDHQMLRLLKQLRADPNKSKITTPLRIAICNDDMPTAEILIKEIGADPNHITDDFHPMERSVLEDKKPWIDFLKKNGGNFEMCNEMIGRKKLAAIWSQGGESTIGNQTFNLEGWTGAAAKALLKEQLTAFCGNTDNEKIIKESAENAIYRQSTETNESLVARHKAKKPVVIFAGTLAHGVSCTVVGNRLYVGNRGEGGTKYGVMTYELKDTDITEEFFKDLRAVQPDMDSFAAIFSKYKWIEKESILRSDQSENNCFWSSAGKGAADALFQHYKLPQATYKKFTASSRLQELLTYLRETKNPDVPLLKKVADKLVHKMNKGNFKGDVRLPEIFAKLKQFTGIDYVLKVKK